MPGVAEKAHGIKTLTEAVFVRDHLLTQLDLADALPDGRPATPNGRSG